MENNKIIKWFSKNSVAIGACALVALIGIGCWVLATAGTTTIGSTITSTGNIVAPGVSQQIVTLAWTPPGTGVSGTSTTWADLPYPMSITMTTSASTIFVDAYFPRVQHGGETDPTGVGNQSTEFQILVDGTSIAETNTGGHLGWNFKSISFHGVSTVTAGSHVIKVQYKTDGHTENWPTQAGYASTGRLTVMEFKN
jgi:hypothetical protein